MHSQLLRASLRSLAKSLRLLLVNNSLLLASSLKLIRSQAPKPHFGVSQYYIPSDLQRHDEILEVLHANLRLPFLEKFFLFCEHGVRPPIFSTKLVFIDIAARLKYSDVLQYINRYSFGDCVWILANSDILLDASLLSATAYLQSGDLLALTRYELDGQLFSAVLPESSQDTWIFCTPLLGPLNPCDFSFELGTNSCDNSFAARMYLAGYKVWNPCLSIKTTHVHASDYRTYSLSQNDRSPSPYLYPLECDAGQFILRIPRRMIFKR